MAARVRLRELTNDGGSRPLRMVRRTSGSVVTWRRGRIVLRSVQGMSPRATGERARVGSPPCPAQHLAAVVEVLARR